MKTVHHYDGNHGAMQALYLNRDPRRPIPNLSFVHSDGSVFFEINELGLKGDARDPSRKLAVVWGDSVVFGVGRGWPCLLDELTPGYQWLNGGIEGADYRAVLAHMVAVNREHEVAVNLVMPGWHHHGYNQELEADLTAACRLVPNPVLATMPSALNPDVVDADISPLFESGDWDRGFYFYGGAEYSIAMQRSAYEHIIERNRIVRRVAATLGVPLVDLCAALDTSGLADIRADFFDILHPRPSAYPKIARAVFEQMSGARAL